MACSVPLSPQALRLVWSLDPAAFLREFEVSPVLGHFVLPLYLEMPEEPRYRLLERIPLLVLPEWREDEPRRAYAAADCAIRRALPLALVGAGLMDSEAFHYLLNLHPIEDRETAHLALLAAWDACVTLARHDSPLPNRSAALEARDAATDAHWGGGRGSWALACAHHAAMAVTHCARTASSTAWEIGFQCLDQMVA